PPGATLFPYTTLFRSKDLIPALRHTNIATLTTPEAMRALAPIIKRAPHMAIKALGYLNDMVDHAIKTGVREDGRTLSLRGAVKRSEEHTSELQSRENL